MTRRARDQLIVSPGSGFTRFFTRPARLPDAVYRELVDMLFSMSLPIAAMGIVFVGVSALLASAGDMIVATLSGLGAIVTALRLAVVRSYLRGATKRRTITEICRWERLYAAGTFAFAFLLALLNVRMLMFHYPIAHMITVSLVFAFGAGVVSRTSMRPVICVISLLIAAVPTIVALAIHAIGDTPYVLHSEMFAIEALLTAITTLLSLQSVKHIYGSIIHHLVDKHDLALLAKQDELTRLPNRLLLRERFQDAQAHANAHANGGGLALLFLDLDGFKGVNDRHGHPTGDAVLREVAHRLRVASRPDDTVARLGGDEFVVLQTTLRAQGEAELLARRIIRELSLPYLVDGIEIRISASVGISLTAQQGWDLDRLMGCADVALYRAKRAGAGQLQFCTMEDEQAMDAAA